jgi:hypothetical protein
MVKPDPVENLGQTALRKELWLNCRTRVDLDSDVSRLAVAMKALFIQTGGLPSPRSATIPQIHGPIHHSLRRLAYQRCQCSMESAWTMVSSKSK